MPNLREHLKISEGLLGYSNSLVHRILDYQGRNLEHRFRHTPKTCDFIKGALGELEYVEAWLHIFSDWGIVKLPLVPKQKSKRVARPGVKISNQGELF